MKTASEKAKAVRAVKKIWGIEWGRIGGLSAPSKMPGFGIGLPASKCNVGAKLAKIPDSVCHECYALKGRYVYKNVKNAQERRFVALNSLTWVPDMVAVIRASCEALGENYFRFQDSGDIQNVKHLIDILQVCRLLPEINFWLPSKEYKLLKLLKNMNVPSNLTIRVSAPMRNLSYNVGLPSSSVTTNRVKGRKTWVNRKAIFVPLQGATLCTAYLRKGECGQCRLCWDKDCKEVSYKKH